MSSTNISVAIATSTTPLRLFAHCKLTQKTTLGLLFAQHHSLLNNSNGIHYYPELAYLLRQSPLGCQLTAGQLACCVCAAGVVSLGYGSFIEHPGPMLFFLNQPCGTSSA